MLLILFYRFRLPRLSLYKYMSPPGTYLSWFMMVFAPQVIVWVGIAVWRNTISTHHASNYVCAGVLWATSVVAAAASNRGLYLTMACATSGS